MSDLHNAAVEAAREAATKHTGRRDAYELAKRSATVAIAALANDPKVRELAFEVILAAIVDDPKRYYYDPQYHAEKYRTAILRALGDTNE